MDQKPERGPYLTQYIIGIPLVLMFFRIIYFIVISAFFSN